MPSSDDCAALGIPPHLHSLGRGAIEVEDTELLYRRFRIRGTKEEWIKEGTQATSSLFGLNKDSYNRSSFCQQPDDVLYDNLGNRFDRDGILSLSVRDLRLPSSSYTIEVNDTNSRIFNCVVEHSPEKCNYSHTEVIVYENGFPAPDRPKILKKVFRKMFVDYSVIVKDFEE